MSMAVVKSSAARLELPNLSLLLKSQPTTAVEDLPNSRRGERPLTEPVRQLTADGDDDGHDQVGHGREDT